MPKQIPDRNLHSSKEKSLLCSFLHPRHSNHPSIMSKLQASSVRSSIKTLVAQSSLEHHKEEGGKKRNFVETIELQIGLKNYDPQRDKRFVSWQSFRRSRPPSPFPSSVEASRISFEPHTLVSQYKFKMRSTNNPNLVRNHQASPCSPTPYVALHSRRRHGCRPVSVCPILMLSMEGA